MASSISILPLMFLLFATFYHIGEATRFLVGGSDDAWKNAVTSPNNTLDHWSSASRFKVSDTLVFNFDVKDWVLEVSKENYVSCNTTKPMEEYKDPKFEVKLNTSGPHYYISGTHCPKGQKITIVVLSQLHKPPTPTTPAPTASTPATPTTPTTPRTSPTTPTTPPTSPATPEAPAPAPKKSAAIGLVAGNGIFWAFVAVIGLVWA
ncbi:unnamed protein product [Cochlearia groenlandica]